MENSHINIAPVNVALEDGIKEDKASMKTGLKMLMSHAARAKRTSLGIDRAETDLKKKWENLNRLIFAYKEAHIECRELNNFFDKLLTIVALITSFITTFLLAIKDVQEEHSSYIYFIECATSGIATFMVGLSNTFDNAGKRESHNNIVIKLRTIGLLTQNMSEIEENRNDITKYHECYGKLVEALGTVNIYQEVRKKHGLDKNLLGIN